MKFRRVDCNFEDCNFIANYSIFYNYDNKRFMQIKNHHTSRIWRSVPQMPEYATLMRTSFAAGLGRISRFFKMSDLLVKSKLKYSIALCIRLNCLENTKKANYYHPIFISLRHVVCDTE